LGYLCYPLTWVLDRPLGVYVILATAITMPAALCGFAAVGNKDLQDCTNSGATTYCLLAGFLGLIHTTFSFYIQSRLVHGLAHQELLKSDGDRDPNKPVNADDLIKEAGHIVLYDVGFCLYLFVFVGSFFYSCSAPSTLDECEPGVPTAANAAAGLLIFFAIFVGCFGSCGLCVLGCDSCVGHISGGQRTMAGKMICGKSTYGQVVTGQVVTGLAAPQQGKPQMVGQPVAQATLAPQPAAQPVGTGGQRGSSGSANPTAPSQPQPAPVAGTVVAQDGSPQSPAVGDTSGQKKPTDAEKAKAQAADAAKAAAAGLKDFGKGLFGGKTTPKE